MKAPSLITRKAYQNRVLRLLENDDLLFVLGMRRAGKSCLIESLSEQLSNRSAWEGALIRIDAEEARWSNVAADDLIKRFDAAYDPATRNVVIADELGCIGDWERAAEHMASKPGVKLVILSSNRRVLSEKLSLVREGRYDIVDVLPLSLDEFIAMHGIKELTSAVTPAHAKRFRDEDGNQLSAGELLELYLTESSVPPIAGERLGDPRAHINADGRYSAAIVHDILETSFTAGLSAITDQALLACIISVLAGSMGRNVSATWVGKQTPLYLDRPSSTKTVESYIRAVVSSNLFCVVERYDIKADQKLKTLMKYYISDLGVYRLIMGRQQEDHSAALESRVFFELLRRGYEVCNGKFGEEEVRFMAVHGHNRVYVQTADVFRERDRRMLLSPLRKIKDNHPKVIIVSDTETRTTNDGILILNAVEFFLGGSWERIRPNY